MKARIALAVVAALVIGQLPLANATRAQSDRFTEIAVAYLTDHASALGVTPADVSTMRVTAATRSSHSGVEHRYLLQQVDGIDVMTGDVSISLMPSGSVLFVGENLIADIAGKASGSAALDPVAATRAAAAHLGLIADPTLRVLETSPGADRPTLMSDGGISRSNIPAHLVYRPVGGELRLGWNLLIDERFASEWWDITVDAETGDVLAKHDLFIRESIEKVSARVSRPGGDAPLIDPYDPPFDGVDDGSTYNVYALPLESPNDGPRSLVTNPAHPEYSPYGWHDTNGQPGPEYTVTRGNNVHAAADWGAGANVVRIDGAASGPGLTFDHPIDFTQPPPAWRDAATTNLFYWNNVIHDAFAGYGFDELSGNFQEKNYSGDMQGSDSVNADAQDLGGVDNANFGTPVEGQNPRMQMFLWEAPSKRQLRDGDLDAGVIIHEYGHGISNRLTGGPYNVGCLNTTETPEQAGEGWSDFFAIALTAQANEGTLRRGLGTYVDGQDKRTDKGIRPTAYFTLNPTPTYDVIKTAAAPHGVGYVWAAMLWEMMWGLVKVHGFNPNPYDTWDTGGNNLAIQLVMDGLKLQKCSPGFVDARNAIIAADTALTGEPVDDPETPADETLGKNRCTIWKAFAKRGLGYTASQGSSSSKTDGTQKFDLPPGC